MPLNTWSPAVGDILGGVGPQPGLYGQVKVRGQRKPPSHLLQAYTGGSLPLTTFFPHPRHCRGSWPTRYSDRWSQRVYYCFPLAVIKHFTEAREKSLGWRDGSEDESTGRSSRTSGFDSQHPRGRAERSVSKGSVALFWPLWVLHAHAAQRETSTHKKERVRKD